MGNDIDNDLLSFWAELSNEDALGVVIRVAIHFENQLTSIIEDRVEHPKHIKDFEFSERLSLVRAFGLDDGIAAPIKSISEVRNRHAHRLTYVFDNQAADNLVCTLTGTLKATYHEWMRGKESGRVSGLLVASSPPIEKFKMMSAVVLVALLQWRSSSQSNL